MKRWLCILGLDFFFLLCNIVLLVHYGFFGDVYPNVKVDKDIIYFTWISLVLTTLGLGVVLRNVITQPKVKKKKKMLIIFVLFCLFGTNLYYGITILLIKSTLIPKKGIILLRNTIMGFHLQN